MFNHLNIKKMKSLVISIFLLIAAFQVSYATTTECLVAKKLINVETQVEQNIHNRIMDAFMNSFAVQNNSKMISLIDEFSSLYSKSQNSIFLYWKGYALYYNSIIYLKNGKKDESYDELKKGIEALESIKKKNSEDCALLSMLHSFSCQFLKFPKVIQASKNATNYIEKAMKLDNNNPRVYYVLANNDYYTPERYGGGSKVEEYALKALSLPAQKIANPYLPSWGRQESYELLTNYYLKKKNMQQAKKYIQSGLLEYPDSYTLKYNKSKL